MANIVGTSGSDVINDKQTVSGQPFATSGPDTIQGRYGDDIIHGGGGDDQIVGGSETFGSDAIGGFHDDDIIYGGDGNDTLSGGTLGDDLYGEAGDDVLNGGDWYDRLTGGVGNDTLNGGDGTDYLYAGNDDDTLNGDAGDDILEGGLGNDIIDGGDGIDVAEYHDGTVAITFTFTGDGTFSLGGRGTDTFINIEGIFGTYFADKLSASVAAMLLGSNGDDLIEGSIYSDQLYGGSEDTGGDTLSYARATGSVTVNFTERYSTVLVAGEQSDKVGDFENIIGSDFADIITGSPVAANKYLGDGVNTLAGGGGADRFMFGAKFGADTVTDFNSAQGDKIVLLSYGAIDSVAELFAMTTVTEAGGNTTIDFGGGNTLTLSNVSKNSLADDDFVFGTPPTVITGTAGKDVINGTSSAPAQPFATNNNENIYGLGDDDIIDALGGDDHVEGGDGNDTLSGGAGNDKMVGGAGNDTVSYQTALSAVSVTLASSDQQNTKGGGKDTISEIENIIGSAFADVLIGNGQINVLEGGAGNDTLVGGYGGDVFDGGDGIDTVSFAGESWNVTIALDGSRTNDGGDDNSAYGDVFYNIENVIGTSGVDWLIGDAGANILNGGASYDRIEGGDGNDTLIGGTGGNMVLYETATSAVSVSLGATGVQNTKGAGKDKLSGFADLFGSAFDDTLIGISKTNFIQGGDGDDVIMGRLGNDFLTGDANGDFGDTVSYAGIAVSISANLGDGQVNYRMGNVAGSDFVDAFENLTGGTADDILSGNALNNRLDGGSGNDELFGDAGNDTLIGGGGADVIDGSDGIDAASYETSTAAVTVNLGIIGAQSTGGAGIDVLQGIENLIGGKGSDRLYGNDEDNQIFGGDGNDTLFGGTGNNMLDGGAGTDIISYVSYEYSVIVYLGSSTMRLLDVPGFETDTLFSIENVRATKMNDYIYGGDSNNTIWGNGGDDWIEGQGGNDVIYGGSGNDLLSGEGSSNHTSDGNDKVYGEAGDDGYWGDLGADLFHGGAGHDTVEYSSIDAATSITVVLANGNGVTQVISSAPSIASGDRLISVEALQGGNGDDVITGNSAKNWLSGWFGDDIITGGGGNDELLGGGGADTFVYRNANEGADRINFFVTGEDKISISRAGFGLSGSLTEADFATDYFVEGAPAAAHGQFIWRSTGSSTFASGLLTWDPDGTGSRTEITIAEIWGGSLHATDFILK